MKHTQIFYTTFVLTLSILLPISLVKAQKIYGLPPTQVSIKTVKESSEKSVYLFKAGNQEAKLSLTQNGSQVDMQLENQACSLGTGQVSVNNGQLNLTTSDLHQGTLGIWVFAAQVVDLKGSAAVLSRRQKAAKKCKNYCKTNLNQPVLVKNFAFLGGTGRQDPPGCVPADDEAFIVAFEDAWEGYANCIEECIEKAKDKYQNKN